MCIACGSAGRRILQTGSRPQHGMTIVTLALLTLMAWQHCQQLQHGIGQTAASLVLAERLMTVPGNGM